MAFEFASTNLVIELGIILALLIGWQFTLAKFVGGPIMILLLAVIFRVFLRERILEAARVKADQGVAGSMGHAAMDMSVQRAGTEASGLVRWSDVGLTYLHHGMGRCHPRCNVPL